MGALCFGESQAMEAVISLGLNPHAGCPKCGRRTSFFSGERDNFISDERNFLADTVLRMECSNDGPFEVMVTAFRTER